MRLLSAALCTTVAAALLAGCSGNMSPSTSGPSTAGQAQSHFDSHGKFIPQWAYPAVVAPKGALGTRGQALKVKFSPEAKKRAAQGGIYASTFFASVINGYPHKNTSNGPPTCSLTGDYVNNVAVDGKGNLIDPDGGTRTVIVYQGPGMCGSEVGSVSDPYGQPSDAASSNAASGEIAVGNIFDNSGLPGSVSICSMSAGCTSNLTNSNMYEVAGVAMDNSGNCYASATNSFGTATLTYFAGCSGGGTAATGYSNSYYGGLDIDANGNLVSVDAFTPAVRVYSGCNPACTAVGGPFSLIGDAVFCHLNKQSMTLACGDFSLGQIDVYYYSPTSLTYWYSFNNGLPFSDEPEGVAYNPRSRQ